MKYAETISVPADRSQAEIKCSICGYIGKLGIKSSPYIHGVTTNNYYVCPGCGGDLTWRWFEVEESEEEDES